MGIIISIFLNPSRLKDLKRTQSALFRCVIFQLILAALEFAEYGLTEDRNSTAGIVSLVLAISSVIFAGELFFAAKNFSIPLSIIFLVYSVLRIGGYIFLIIESFEQTANKFWIFFIIASVIRIGYMVIVSAFIRNIRRSKEAENRQIQDRSSISVATATSG